MRPPRICFIGGVYHVTIRCNNREFFFQDNSDFLLFLKILLAAKVKYDVYIYGYCLTNNHVHLLVGTPEQANLSAFMQYLNGNFAQAYNKKHGKTGRFWGGRFYSTVIEEETQFFNTLLYIEFNMVRCRVVDAPEDWHLSSYRAHALGESNTLLDFHPLYLALGATPEERQEIYRTMAEDRLREAGLKRNPAFSKGIILGSEGFVQSLIDKYGEHAIFYYSRKIYKFVGNSYSLHRAKDCSLDTG